MSVGAAPAEAAGPRIGFGQVFHERHAPVRHRFSYRTTFLLLPLRRLAARPDPVLARHRPAAFRFRDADHGDGGPDALAWFDALLAREGIDDADGEAWLHCFPRQLGVAFKPVSFWYAHRADGSLAAVLAEVHNTFGERHAYLLETPPDGPAFGPTYVARKVFHVSPFCETRGEYRFTFTRSDLDAPDGRGRTAVRIDWHEDPAAGPTLVTSVSGVLEPFTAASRRRAMRTSPLMTLAIVARIHWQALQLWRRRVAIVPHAPQRPTAVGQPSGVARSVTAPVTMPVTRGGLRGRDGQVAARVARVPTATRPAAPRYPCALPPIDVT